MLLLQRQDVLLFSLPEERVYRKFFHFDIYFWRELLLGLSRIMILLNMHITSLRIVSCRELLSAPCRREEVP